MTPDILDYLGDIGGLNDLLFTIFTWFLSSFSTNRIYAILMNRLFHINDGMDEGRKALDELKQDPNFLMKGTKDFGGLELNVPMFFSAH